MDANSIEPKESVSAGQKLGKKDAAAMAKVASKLIVAKARKVTEWNGAETSSRAAVEAMLGPTGNLRAPTLLVGKTLLVGFNEDVYSDALT